MLLAVKPNVSCEEIADFLQLKLVGNNFLIESAVSIDDIQSNALVFSTKYEDRICINITNKNDLLAIVSPDYEGKLNCAHIISEQPKLDFVKIVSVFFYDSPEYGVDSTAIIENCDNLGSQVAVGAHSRIGKNVVIGDGTRIGNNVTIAGKVKIGCDCVIKSGAVIGEEGFGFVYDETGKPIHFPHIGQIIIGDRVFIGSNATIECATLSTTILNDDVKVDDLVQIGHNCIVGAKSMIMSGAVLCGGVVLGKGCWIAPNSSIRQRFTIGDDSMVGLGAVVVSDVPPNTVVVGNPAKPMKR